MESYEKLGAFYLGRRYDLERRCAEPVPILYDARDLTTHGVCVGMTGSGKTGLCVSLLEEAAIDGIPVIAIDPKGDLGNILLAFPDLKPQDFEPWVDEAEALRAGQTRPQYAASVAARWRQGLAEWDQDGDRIRRLLEASDFCLYTPGSRAGTPLSILRSLAAPPTLLRADPEALGDRVQSAASGLLGVLGVDADPIQSKEHILLSSILRGAWGQGRDVDLAQLIGLIQTPPFERVGVFDLEAFLPARDRLELAMRLNNLLASPSFEGWIEGEPLDAKQLLWTPEGKPRVAVLSIAHLSEAQRMLFVTLLLNEVVAWMRTQPGTASLRALLYMDEVFGYLPPTANPPSKLPLLTLLKQARGFGVGCLLASQNPVDLDYKALSNAGTWFLGRLQTERDRGRVLDGLEGVSGGRPAFERPRLEQILSGLGSRVFLMNNVHEDEPVVFQSRWALSYLRGPLTRSQIQQLTAARALPEEPAQAGMPRGRLRPPAGRSGQPVPPPLPPGMPQGFLAIEESAVEGEDVVYRPALLGEAQAHFVSATAGLDVWEPIRLLAALDDGGDPWTEAEVLEGEAPALETEGVTGAGFADLPRGASTAESRARWERLLKAHVYRSQGRTLWSCKLLEERSRPGESESDFRVRLAQAARERRDLEVEKLRKRFAPSQTRLEDRLRTAQERVEREKSQHSQQKLQTAISFGSGLLGALLGRKKASLGTLSRAATAMRGVGRVSREREDVERATARIDVLVKQLAELEEEFEVAADALRARFDVDALELTEKTVRPRKADISVESLTLVWLPWRLAGDAPPEALFE